MVETCVWAAGCRYCWRWSRLGAAPGMSERAEAAISPLLPSLWLSARTHSRTRVNTVFLYNCQLRVKVDRHCKIAFPTPLQAHINILVSGVFLTKIDHNQLIMQLADWLSSSSIPGGWRRNQKSQTVAFEFCSARGAIMEPGKVCARQILDLGRPAPHFQPCTRRSLAQLALL